MNIISVLFITGIILVALVVLGLILTRLYRRASKEVSFVRTGFGGEKVIMNGLRWPVAGGGISGAGAGSGAAGPGPGPKASMDYRRPRQEPSRAAQAVQDRLEG